MRRLIVICALGLAAAAFVPVGGSAPSAVERRSCAQPLGYVNIQLLGNVAWGWRLQYSSGLPKKTTVAAVWSDGGPQRNNGVAVYGLISKGTTRFSTTCRRVRATTARAAALRPAIRVKDGWFYGRKYTCFEQGRIVLETRDLAGGAKRLTVRVQRTGALLAVAEVRRGGGWLRASRRCSESER